jgi:hypothetical protein
MIHQLSFRRAVLLLGLLLASSAVSGCPDDDETGDSTTDGGDGHSTADAGETECPASECDSGQARLDGGSTEHDAAMVRELDSSTGESDAGGGEVNGGEITGDAVLHLDYSGASGDSNVKEEDLHSTAPSGSSAINADLRGTSLSASGTVTGGQQSVTIFLAGEIRVGATFELVLEPFNATTDGTGYVQVLQSSFSPIGTHIWRAESGTITLEAVQGNKLKISSTTLPMIVATSNAPGNAAVGTFDVTIEGQVFDVGGL